MKQYYIYLTTNLINNMKYIGMHYGELDDAYLGSGLALQRAIKKYGKENFKKEILHISKTLAENGEQEKLFIQKYNAIADPMFYNIHEGGFGGNTQAGWSDERKEQFKYDQSIRFTGENNPRYGVKLSEETKQKIRENRNTDYMLTEKYRQTMSLAVSGEKNGMFGKHHTTESKQKMSDAKKGQGIGKENGNAKKIYAYKDAEHTVLVKEFDCIQDALVFVSTRSNDYSGISKRMKENKPYKGYYWVKCRD